MFRRKMFVISFSLREFHYMPQRFGKYDGREAKVMQKIMKGSITKKKSWYREDGINNTTTMSLPSTKSIQHGGQSSRRVSVLNKLFMTHITDLMATGEVAHELIGRGIEIARVKVASDFSRVNVYWLSKASTHTSDTEEMLKRNAGQLRHELSRLRIIGSVPMIEFIKDKQYNRLAEVDTLLANADFGDDYTPVDPSHLLKSGFLLNTTFPREMKKSLEHPRESEILSEEPPLPEMRMDVLGLNHLEIMTKVIKSVKKSQALHRLEPEAEKTDLVDETISPSHDENVQHSRANFAEFILKRQRQQQKALQQAKNYQPELEMHEKEWREREMNTNFFYQDDDDDEEFENEMSAREHQDDFKS